MLPLEPSAQQYRAGAAALVIVALLTLAMIAVTWVDSLDGPLLLLPLVVSYFLFNVGFIFAAVKGGLQTNGGRLGATAVSLNFAAMLLSDVTVIWTALSAGAALAALLAAYLLLNDARASGT